MGFPTIFPTGVTLYSKEKAYNGYTVFHSAKGAQLIDMNGREVKTWTGTFGFPDRILPGGYLVTSSGRYKDQLEYLERADLIQVDWDGNIVWKFDKNVKIKTEDGEAYVAKQSHDWQRVSLPAGYFSPGSQPKTEGENTLIITHDRITVPEISPHAINDERIIEIDWDGNIVWSWRASDHFEELGFDELAKSVIYRTPGSGTGKHNWLNINNISILGENKWYDQGDERFHPDNILFDTRQANILGIIEKKTGKIVWRLGPDFSENGVSKKLGEIMGQHHLHMIQKGLPGEGDILVFDNGGPSGYGAPTETSTTGLNHYQRNYSRVLQFNPTTLDITWQYTPEEAGFDLFTDPTKFFSAYVSSAQRLPNGNTLITEGSDGRILEVTADHEIVWEYVNPYFEPHFRDKNKKLNYLFRAYRVPYEWVPQLSKPEEVDIEPIDIETFRVPGTVSDLGGQITEVK